MGQSFDHQRVLCKPLMANLSTVCEDGPRNSPVWFIWEDDALWMLASKINSAVRRINVDPRCAVEIVDFDGEKGTLLHLGLRGAAEVFPMDPALFRRLLARYLGPDETTWNPWFIEHIAAIDDPDGRLICLRPESVFTNNVSYFRTGPELADE